MDFLSLGVNYHKEDKVKRTKQEIALDKYIRAVYLARGEREKTIESAWHKYIKTATAAWKTYDKATIELLEVKS